MDTKKSADRPACPVDLRHFNPPRAPIRRTTPTTRILPLTTTARPKPISNPASALSQRAKPTQMSEYARAKAKQDRMLKSMNDYSQPAPETITRAEQHAAMLESGQTIDEYYSVIAAQPWRAPSVKLKTTVQPELVDTVVPVNHVKRSEDAYLKFVRKATKIKINEIDNTEDLELEKPTNERLVKTMNTLSLSAPGGS